jgi:hypothetical protein
VKWNLLAEDCEKRKGGDDSGVLLSVLNRYFKELKTKVL